MNKHTLVLGFLLALTGALLTAQTSAPAPTTQAIKIGGQRELKDFRLRGPRLVYKSDVKISVEAPPNASDELLLNDAAYALLATAKQSNRTATTQIKLDSPNRPATAPTTQTTQPATQARRRTPLFTGEAAISLTDWPDGPADLSLEINHQGQTKILAQRFEIVRQKVATLKQDQDEIKTWLDEVNEQPPIWGWQPTWDNLPRALEGQPLADMRGFILRSYENPQLERRQPYTMYVPHSLDVSKPQPLLIVLHGSGGDYRNIISDEAAGQRYEKFPMLIANAGAFRNQEFRHMALNDVRWVIEDVKKKYNVDASRIYVQGISLGGRGTLELAALLPDTFAAGSSHGTYGVNEDAVDPLQLLTTDQVAAHLSLRSDMRTFLPNLHNTPIEMVFGWKDDTTPPGGALLLAAAIREAGGTVVERGFNTTHNISLPDYDWATTREWFLKHKLDPKPLTVKHRVTNLRFNTNRWVTVHELADYTKVGNVEATYYPKTKVLRVVLQNVQRVSITPPDIVERVLINDAPPLSSTTRFVYIAAKGRFDWEVHSVVPDSPKQKSPAKRPGQSGPMWDVFSEPFTYVYGGRTPQAELLKKSAERSADWDMAFGSDKFTPIALADLTPAHKARNLILFLTPDEVTTLFGKDSAQTFWPLSHLPANLPIGPTANLRLAIRPSPFHAERSVLIVEVSTPEPVNLHQLGWWDAGLQSDWVIASQFKDQRNRTILQLRAAGSYTHAWGQGTVTHTDYRRQSLLGPGSRN